jgi:hypothetical protein
MKSVARRVVDRRVLHLIKMWLECSVEETDDRGEKTRICKVPEGEFDFLGFTFVRMYSPRTGQARLALRPSKKSIRRMLLNTFRSC